MRIAPFVLVASFIVLAACGGRTGQANNAQANASNSDLPPETANESNVSNAMVMIAAKPLPAGQALKVMHDRHEAMEGLGKAMKALHRALESSPPDINVIRVQTSAMASTASKIPTMFPPGTGPDVGKTRAKPEIWTQQDLFIRRSKEFLAAAQAIDGAAKSGDVNKVMALHDNVDKACKACHDPFRAPEHDQR